MKRFMMTVAAGAVAVCAVSAGSAVADVSAFLLGNENYRTLPRVAGGHDLPNVRDRLTDPEVNFTLRKDLTAAGAISILTAWVNALDVGETIVVGLSGHFVTDGGQTWFLGVDANRPTLFSVALQGVSLDSVMRVMADYPGGAILILGQSEGENGIAPRLQQGIGALDIPQGVTVVRASPSGADRAMADLIEKNGRLPTRGVEGFVPRRILWNTQTSAGQKPVTAVDPGADLKDWRAAQGKDTIAAYRSYLRTYPAGQNAAQATAMIREIETEPNRAARKAEEALGLSRDARREIQRDLSVLDYNTRGIDGLFGPGSRGAIAQWQGATDLAETGYLSENQITRLDAQAVRRVAQLEAEAERKRAQAARLDQAFWEETGALGGEASFRAYLSRYPDGDYAEVATAKLEAIAIRKRARAAKADQAAWDKFAAQDTPKAYQSYLTRFPDGAFKAEADAKLAGFAAASQAAEANGRHATTEAKLNLSPSLNRMVELRLAQLGLKPGVVDGTFDAGTRRAIRRYQKDRNLDVTGYMNQPTAVRMLSGGFSIKLR